MNFKKITALAGSVLMAGLSITTAAAASFPQPFVQNGVGDVAIVYGANAAATDVTAAQSINTALKNEITSTKVSTVTGDNYQIKRSSNALYLNTGFTDIVNGGVLRDSELKDLLSDGVYLNADNDEVDFTQEVTLVNKNATYFSDRNYENKAPTLGYVYEKNEDVLNYTMTFDESLTSEDMLETDLTILGKEYYVLSGGLNETTLTLLDTSSTFTLSEGQSATVNGKSVVVDFISSGTTSEAKLTIDGVAIKSLKAGDTYKLKDDSVVAVKEVLYSAKEGTASRVELTIGSGKLILTDGSEVELNGNTVDNLYSHFGANNDSITLAWKADSKLFLTSTNELLMPGFEAIKLTLDEIPFPTPSSVVLEGGEDQVNLIANIEKGELELPLLYRGSDGNFSLGAATDEVLVTTNTTHNDSAITGHLLNLSIDEEPMFVATYISSNGNVAYSYAYQLSSIKESTSDGKIAVKLVGLAGESDLDFSDVDKSVYVKDLTFTLKGTVVTNESTTTNVSTSEDFAYIELSATGGSVYLDKLVTTDGLVMNLPVSGVLGAGTVDISFWEEDKDGYVNRTLSTSDASFKATIKAGDGTTDGGEVEVTSTSGFMEQSDVDNSKITYGYVKSPLATKMTLDKTSSVNAFEIEYYGEPTELAVYVAESGATITSENALGDLMFKDSQVSSISASKLIVVGGSCINSAAATLLGGALCTEEFTAKTGVGANEYLVKAYANSAINNKFALLVAGYNAADTVAGVNKVLSDKSLNLETVDQKFTTAASSGSM